LEVILLQATDAALSAFGRMTALRRLEMGISRQLTRTDAGFAALAQSRSLQELNMQETITDAAHLSCCASLTNLSLNWCTQSAWSTAGPRALASSRSLRRLDIGGTRLCEHAALLSASGSLCELHATLLSVEQRWRDHSFTDWARAHAALITRLASLYCSCTGIIHRTPLRAKPTHTRPWRCGGRHGRCDRPQCGSVAQRLLPLLCCR
jgi:hypothetical protein